MKRCYFFITFLSLLWACSSQDKSGAKVEMNNGEPKSRSEKHFLLKDSLEYKIIEVKEPFLNSAVTERYLLYPRGSTEPNNIPATVKIATPINRVAINSTTHLGFIKNLKQMNSIKAVSNPELYYDSSFVKKVNEGEIVSIGTKELNYEQLIESKVDLLFSFAIDATSYQEAKKLRDLGQKVILIAEYMEQDPIHKAEWLKVFAAFYSQKEQQRADSIGEFIQKNYDQIKMRAMLYSFSPLVMIGLPWKGTWYVSGGESYQAQLIKDANARYLWQRYQQTASVPLDIETAINEGLSADFWINPGTVQFKEELAERHQNFEDFKSFNSDQIFTNYLKSNELGANDYWESAVVRPDLVLKDLVSIFHNKELDSLNYYKLVK